jgi:hypothetical protein
MLSMICQIRSVVDQETEDRDFALCMLLHKTVDSLLYLYINKDIDSCAMLDQQFGLFEVIVNARCNELQRSPSFRNVRIKSRVLATAAAPHRDFLVREM